MIDLLKLQDNSIIITPNGVKDLLIKQISENNPSLRFKFMDKVEFLKNCRPHYEYDAVIYLHKKGYSYDSAIELLDNIVDAPKTNDKLALIKSLYDELIDHDLLKYNNLFPKLFANKKTYLYGYSKLDNELINAVANITTNYEIIEPVSSAEYSHEIKKFEQLEEEVAAVFNDISKLVHDKVSLNHIYLYKYSREYELIIKKYAHYFNFPIYFDEDLYIFDTPIYKAYLKNIDVEDPKTLENAYQIISEKYAYDPLKVLDKIASCVNKVYGLKISIAEKIDLINEIAKQTKISKIKYEEAINLCDSSNILNDDDYVFMLGFDVASYPMIHKDVDFYLDDEKLLLGMNTSTILNKIEVEKLTSFIKNTKNVNIYFKNFVGNKEYYISPLVDSLGIKQVQPKKSIIRYNKALAELEVAKLIDNYYSYGLENSFRKAIDYEEMGYNNFDHSFKGLEDFKIDNKLELSYTSIDEYNSCPFCYFVKRILRADIFETRFVTNVGNLFHQILEDSLSKTIDFNDYKQVMDEKFKTNKEKFLLSVLMPQIEAVLKFNESHRLSTDFDHWMPEVQIKMQIDYNTYLVGKIDKMMFDDNNNQAVVVDYKSGKFKFDEKKVEYGIGMQLPLYTVLMKNKYPNIQVVGLYIQTICKEPKHNIDTMFEVEVKYPLEGLTLNDLDVVKRLDNMMDADNKKSNYISKIALTGKGDTLGKSGVIEYSRFNELAATAYQKVIETSENIRSGKFDIKPKVFKDKGACDYCPCKDICFRDENDYEFINTKEKEKEDEA